VPVEELHTIANGLGQRRTGEGCIEWLEVQLKNKVVVGAEIYKSKRLQTIIYDLKLFFLTPPVLVFCDLKFFFKNQS